jgi:hypothetical protein
VKCCTLARCRVKKGFIIVGDPKTKETCIFASLEILNESLRKGVLMRRIIICWLQHVELCGTKSLVLIQRQM